MRPFQFSSASSGGSLRLSVNRWKVTGGAAAALGLGAAGGAGACLLLQSNRVKNRHTAEKRFLMPQAAAEAICGAVGELTQIAVLYPLDTIKVRCQAQGASASAVMAALLQRSTPAAALRTLYAGVVGAALCSIVVGALHWTTYCSAKRLAASALTRIEAMRASSSPTLSPSSAPSTAPSSTLAGPAASADGAAAAAAGQDALPARSITNVVASIASALVTALIEAPAELFRHNAQAGLMHGNFMSEMARVAARSGPAALYRGFLPYCFESWPYDVTELLTYGHLKDLQADLQPHGAASAGAAAAPAGPAGASGAATGAGRGAGAPPPNPAVAWAASALPPAAWDLGIGAAAGTTAVVLSMPFDCVKTFMQTHAGEMRGRGLLGVTAEFYATGRRMVARSGVGALYVGVVPRLLQQVPACMVCWWAIEATARALEPYVDRGAEEAEHAAGVYV